MNQKWAWFLLGAVFASICCAIVMLGLNGQLMKTFLGFGGH
jgi:hypothetical protein